MRSREEIAAISNEIEWNVSRKIKLEEMAKTAKKRRSMTGTLAMLQTDQEG